jgi:hypothetical protein
VVLGAVAILLAVDAVTLGSDDGGGADIGLGGVRLSACWPSAWSRSGSLRPSPETAARHRRPAADLRTRGVAPEVTG